ncbi:DUF3822 family protein [bacterium]|nr:DUF3822 family protein [bacterium]
MEIGENNNKISIFSKEIDFNKTENYHLSIEVSEKKICYTLLEIETLEYVFFKSITTNSKSDDLVKTINSEDILKNNFSSSTITYKDYPSIIIPNNLYSEQHKRKYLQFLEIEYEQIISENIKTIDSTILYSINKNINDIVNLIQVDIKQKNASNINIHQILRQYGKSIKKRVFLFINQNKIELIVTQNSKLIFQNYFNIDSKTDILYYTLFCFEQLKIDPNINETYLFGEIKKDDKKYTLLFEYIRNIQFGEISTSLNFSKELMEVSKHQNFSLFSQLLCV